MNRPHLSRLPGALVDRLLDAPSAVAVALAVLPVAAAVTVFGVLQVTEDPPGQVTTLVSPVDPVPDGRGPTTDELDDRTPAGADNVTTATTTTRGPSRREPPPPTTTASRTRQAVPPASTVSGAPPAPPTPSAPDPLAAYGRAGYGDVEAGMLAYIWGSADATDAKVAAGRLLLDGMDVPVSPGDTPRTVSGLVAAQAFARAGYRREQAEILARGWGSPNPDVAGEVAGRRLLGGVPVPIRPHDTARTAPARFARIAYGNAGYGERHLEPLSEVFPGLTPDETKVAAGRVILDGRRLPVPPG